MPAALLTGRADWACPNCPATDSTLLAVPNRYHNCPGLHGLVAPLVRAGTDAKVTAVERGDYLNGEEQRTGDDGRPYMAVVTEHGDGSTDAAVFPAVAVCRLGGR